MSSLLEEFENAFQACLAPYIYPTSSHIFEDDELKANAENITRFLELSRQIENHFITKRAILADQRPELILSEEISELKAEVTRKDQLLSKYHDKLNKWTAIVNDTCSGKLPTLNQPPLGHPAMLGPGGGGGGVPPNSMAMQLPPNMRLNQVGAGGPPANMLGHPSGLPPSLGLPPGGVSMKAMPASGSSSVNSPMGGGHAVGSPMNVSSAVPIQQIRPQGSPLVVGGGQQMSQMAGGGNFSQGNPNSVGGPMQGNHPLAYLERTTSNIGMLDSRR